MTSPEQVKTKRDRRSRLIRKSFRGIGESGIVGYFPHQRVPDRMTIREHRVDNGSGPIIYTVKTDTPLQNVVEIGTEMNSLGMGFDYVVASVNKRTGETRFKSARMFKFEGRYTEDRAITLGIKSHPPVDYSANHSISSASWSEKRHELTEQFGSSMKRKIQEAATRRSVNASVLDEMVKTSFASETVIKNREQIKLEDITLVQQAESSILPPAVQAEIPKNIYPLKMFISEDEVEQLREAAEARIKTGKVQLLQNGWPDVLFKTCPDYAVYTGIKAVAFEMLACQAYTLGIMSKNKSILKKDLDEYPFDAGVLEKVQLEYMPKEFDRGSSGRAMPRLFFKTEEKERLAAWTLALAITLSPGCAIPVSPWQDSINMPPKSVEKILTGLGCTVGHCSTEEAVATGSIQSARLLRPPQLDKKAPKKMRR